MVRVYVRIIFQGKAMEPDDPFYVLAFVADNIKFYTCLLYVGEIYTHSCFSFQFGVQD